MEDCWYNDYVLRMSHKLYIHDNGNNYDYISSSFNLWKYYLTQNNPTVVQYYKKTNMEIRKIKLKTIYGIQ